MDPLTSPLVTAEQTEPAIEKADLALQGLRLNDVPSRQARASKEPLSKKSLRTRSITPLNTLPEVLQPYREVLIAISSGPHSPLPEDSCWRKNNDNSIHDQVSQAINSEAPNHLKAELHCNLFLDSALQGAHDSTDQLITAFGLSPETTESFIQFWQLAMEIEAISQKKRYAGIYQTSAIMKQLESLDDRQFPLAGWTLAIIHLGFIHGLEMCSDPGKSFFYLDRARKTFHQRYDRYKQVAFPPRSSFFLADTLLHLDPKRLHCQSAWFQSFDVLPILALTLLREDSGLYLKEPVHTTSGILDRYNRLFKEQYQIEHYLACVLHSLYNPPKTHSRGQWLGLKAESNVFFQGLEPILAESQSDSEKAFAAMLRCMPPSSSTYDFALAHQYGKIPGQIAKTVTELEKDRKYTLAASCLDPLIEQYEQQGEDDQAMICQSRQLRLQQLDKEMHALNQMSPDQLAQWIEPEADKGTANTPLTINRPKKRKTKAKRVSVKPQPIANQMQPPELSQSPPPEKSLTHSQEPSDITSDSWQKVQRKKSTHYSTIQKSKEETTCNSFDFLLSRNWPPMVHDAVVKASGHIYHQQFTEAEELINDTLSNLKKAKASGAERLLEEKAWSRLHEMECLDLPITSVETPQKMRKKATLCLDNAEQLTCRVLEIKLGLSKGALLKMGATKRIAVAEEKAAEIAKTFDCEADRQEYYFGIRCQMSNLGHIASKRSLLGHHTSAIAAGKYYQAKSIDPYFIAKPAKGTEAVAKLQIVRP